MADFKTASQSVMLLLRFSRKLWVRVALLALLAVAAAVAALFLEEFIPQSLRRRIAPDTVMPILTILASGMLAVSTFSLNVMVSAHNAAASQATPRAHRILLADTTTQTVLATFIGAFVYALTSIILLRAGIHGGDSSVTVLLSTVAVVVLVILALLRWIDHLSDLGSMDATLRATEAEARSSLQLTRRAPALRASPLTAETLIPTEATPVPSPRSGYLQFIDVAHMNEVIKTSEARIYIHTAPGQYLLTGQPVAYATGLSDKQVKSVQNGLTIGQHRTFEQDATYGLLVLSEIASRALSPGVNDPGTAIDVIARQERLLWNWARTDETTGEPKFPRIFVPELSRTEMIQSAFSSTARDGAGTIEVVCRLLHALRALQDTPDPALAKAAAEMSQTTRQYAESALTLKCEKEVMRQSHDAPRLS
ncbi:DUF2254 domain-containing protein [Roseovarius sp. A21]|uniref:DUF2254 domain-containing protein n=1 Tax=Roseovarius bejariae TaxID=2576383 RepID=A0A844CP80_9RHOB|nr:DUF2254 domain-containing protein [Roseovarius bejariae]MRU15285.1 DUF2254 domain-containing protein [Roseovarius bejariae]